MSEPTRDAASRAATFLLIGGSAGLGRALAERFATAGNALVLVSSDLRDTQALASDLTLRCDVPVCAIALDLAAPALSLSKLDAALAGLPPLAGVLLPAGSNRTDDAAGQGAEAFAELTLVNYMNLCRIVDYCLPRLERAPSGLVVGFGSIAATRGRRRNVAYSAAKRALQSYFESLRHAVAGSGIRVQFYVLGYLDTNLAFGQRTPLPRASPHALAELVHRRRGDDFGVLYYPRYWRPICMVLRALPWPVFRRLSF